MTGEQNKCRERGFTLLEMLVAFVILSLTLAILMQALGTSLRSAAQAEQFLRATTLAGTMMANVGHENDIREGEAHGNIDDIFRWRQTVKPYVHNPASAATVQPGVAPYQIELTIAWGEAGQEHAIKLTSLRLAASPQDSIQ